MQSKVVPARSASAAWASAASTISTPGLASSWRMLSRCRASSSTTRTRRSVCENLASSWRNAVDELIARDRLQRVADGAALERLVRVVLDGEDVHGHVTGARVALQLLEHAEARLVGQVDVEQDGARTELHRGRQAVARRRARAGTGSRARGPGRAGCRRRPRRPRSPGSAALSASSASRSSCGCPTAAAGAAMPATGPWPARRRVGSRREQPGRPRGRPAAERRSAAASA